MGQGNVHPTDRRDEPIHVAHGEIEAVRIWLLGEFRVSVGSRTISEDRWRLRKARSLVKLLALAPGHRLHREQLIESLWPELNRGPASNNLRYALHIARRAFHENPDLAKRYLSSKDEQIALCPDAQLWVDVEAFKNAVLTARSIRQPAAYRAAVELYAGELLPDDRYEEWTQNRREELIRSYLTLLVELAESYEEQGEYDAAAEIFQRARVEDPTLLEARAGLIRAYAATGAVHRVISEYEQLRKVLAEADMTPSRELRRLYEEAREGRVPQPPSTHRAPRDPSSGRPPHNLPHPITSFVGREREMVEVKRLLAMSRLLTITGFGGCGKTRLSLEVARELAGAYPDGVWLVELASLSDPELLPQAIAGALSVSEQSDRPVSDTLVEVLRDRRTLLVLDNCEHLTPACAELASKLVSHCEHLRIMATSREALGVVGEVVWRLPPLSMPDPDRITTPEGLAEVYESVRLFVERTRLRLPSFEVTPHNARPVAEICRRLEGIPLAIELATARASVLAVEQVAERLDDSLRLLGMGSRTAPPRHQTLRATLDWSYGLLDESERRLFWRLSVFAGDWTLEAAEAVGSGDGIGPEEFLDLLGRLVEKSLVVAGTESGGVASYRMLEPVRQYGREKLEESGEVETVRDRHALWHLGLAELADARLRGPEQTSWVQRLESEQPELQAALEWSLEHDPEQALQLAGTLGHFWYAHGHIAEGRRWLEAALAKTGAAEKPIRARALHVAGVVSEISGHYERAAELYEESLKLWRRLGDEKEAATVLSSLGSLAYTTGDIDQAVARTEESLSIKRRLGDERGTEVALSNLGEIMQAGGDLARARALFEESLRMARAMQDDRSIAFGLLNLGRLAIELDDPARAEALLLDALRAFQRLGDADSMVESLQALGWAAGISNDPDRSAALLGVAEAAREVMGVPMGPSEWERYKRLVTLSSVGTDEESWTASWKTGRAMSLGEAAHYALSTQEKKVTAPPKVPCGKADPRRTGPRLSRREREVALLLTRGLTNRQIAEELVLSEHTIDTHVHNILRKLRLRSRAQIAVWAAEQRSLPEGPG